MFNCSYAGLNGQDSLKMCFKISFPNTDSLSTELKHPNVRDPPNHQIEKQNLYEEQRQSL